jgi:hypothetical protein
MTGTMSLKYQGMRKDETPACPGKLRSAGVGPVAIGFFHLLKRRSELC